MIREHNERMTASYYAAVIPLWKKIPKLDRLLLSDEEKAARKQTVEEQIAIALQWTAAVSGGS